MDLTTRANNSIGRETWKIGGSLKQKPSIAKLCLSSSPITFSFQVFRDGRVYHPTVQQLNHQRVGCKRESDTGYMSSKNQSGFSQGENIADNGGVSAAYRAYRRFPIPSSPQRVGWRAMVLNPHCLLLTSTPTSFFGSDNIFISTYAFPLLGFDGPKVVRGNITRGSSIICQ